MAAFSSVRSVAAVLAGALVAATLQSTVAAPAEAAAPVPYHAPALPTYTFAAPPTTVVAPSSLTAASPFGATSIAAANAAGLKQAAPLAAQMMVEPGPSLLAANELPVRFVPNTTITTPVRVTNTYTTTLPATYQVSYRWTEVGSTTDITTPGDRNYAALGVALAPGQSVTVNLQVRTPINSDNGAKRLDYDLYLDLWTGSAWLSTTSPPVATNDRPPLLCGMVSKGLLCPDRLVEDPTSDQLGLEKFLTYAGEPTGAGTQLMTNLYGGNLVWSYDAMQNPSVGPSTFVRLAYNSMDVSDSGAGYGWSVQAATMTRVGTVLSVPNGNAVKKEMTFVDGDGTTHIYKLPTGETDADGVLSYKRAAGVALELTRELARPEASQWVLTRPDGTRFFFSQATGLPTSVQDRNGNVLSFTHDGDGQLTSLVDASGRTTLTLGWSGRHLRWMKDVSGRGIKLTYTGTDQLASIEDGGGFDSATQTFAAGQPVKKFSFTYTTEPVNKNAKLASVKDPRGATTSVVYYTAQESSTYKLWPKRLTDRRGQGTGFVYSDPDGTAGKDMLSHVTDENGSIPSKTTYRIDGFGRTTSIKDANANAAGTADATKMVWDADHNVIRLEEPNGAVSTWVFDARTGYPLQIRDAKAVANGTPATMLTYKRLTSAPGAPTLLESVTSAAGRTSTFTHDPKGNLATVTDGLGNTTGYTYNANGTLAVATDANGHTTTYENYDANAMPQRILDGLQKPTVFVYDVRGNVTKVTDALNQVTSAAYDAFGRPTSVTTPHRWGSTRTALTEYDLNDNIVKETAATGAQTTSTYSAMDELLSTTLPPNTVATRRIDYTYDVLGRRVSETSPVGTATTTNATDGQTLYTYDRIGQVLTVKTPYVIGGVTRTPTTTYTYDKVGNVTKVLDPNKTATADTTDYSVLYGYDLNHQQVSSTDPTGAVTRTEYDRDGLVTAEVDAQGNRRTYEYDAASRLVASTTPHTPTGGTTQLRTTRFAYDKVGNRTRVTKPSGLFSETEYDAADRPVQVRSPFDAAQADYATPVRTFYEYDAIGQLKRQSEPVRAAAGQQWTNFSYHPSGDLATQTDPWGITTSYQYDKNGQQTERTIYPNDGSGARSMSWTYFPDGALRSRSDGDTVYEQYAGPNDGNFTATGGYIDNGSYYVSNPQWDYEYRRNRGGAVFEWTFQATRPGTYSVFMSCDEYSRTGRRYDSSVPTTNVDSTDDCSEEGGQQTSGWWRPFDVVVSSAGPITLTLDGSEEPYAAGAAMLEPADVQTSLRSFEYDYDADGQRTAVRSLVDGSLRNRFAVTSDGLGQTTKVEEFAGAATTAARSTAYTYDLSGNMLTSFAQRAASATTNQAAARYTEYTWDVRDLVQRVRTGSSPSDPTLKSTTFTYDTRAMRATMTKPNGNVTTYGYFEDGLPRSTVERRSGGPLVASHDLSFNQDGHRSKDVSVVARPGTGQIDQTTTFTYTPVGQLASSMKSNDANGDDEEYRYDAAGNITWQRVGGKVTDYTYDRNRLLKSVTGGVTYNHDYDPWGRASQVRALGQVVKKYTYDGFDRMVRDQSLLTNGANDVTKTTVYDAFDRTTSETRTIRGGAPKTTRYVYLGLSDQVATEEQQNASGAWAIAKSYVYGAGGERLGMVDSPVDGSTAKTYYYGTNPHGDTETLTDGTTGETRSTYAYTAYGTTEKKGTTGLDEITGDPVQDADVVNPYRFNGKRFDGATGKYDMGFRDYDPGLNRYLSRDMYNGALDDMALGMDPWSTNRYAFAGGNPITGVELDGHMTAADGGGSGGGPATEAAEEDADDDNDEGSGCSNPISCGWSEVSDAVSSVTEPIGDATKNALGGAADATAKSWDFLGSCAAPGSESVCRDYLSGEDHHDLEGAVGDVNEKLDVDEDSNAYWLGGFCADWCTLVGGAVSGGGGAAKNGLKGLMKLFTKKVVRDPKDVAVNPVPPKALPLNRPIGLSATQNARVQNDIKNLRAQGATDFRVNQQQVNVNGVRVGVNRPDLQYTLNGVRHYAEYDVPPPVRAEAHKARIEANDPNGVVDLFTVP